MQNKNQTGSENNELEGIRLDALTEIGNIGAGNATTALSQMLNARVEMYVPKAELLAFKDLAEIVGGAETVVVGVMLKLMEDVEGSMLFMLRCNSAHHLVNQLMGENSDENNINFTDMELSALTEIGNIITGAYLSSISALTNLTIVPSIPYLSIDMAGAILSVPAIEFGKLGDRALLIESQFKDFDVDIGGYFILIPTLESHQRIMESLGI